MLAGYPEPTPQERAAKQPAQHRLLQYHAGAGVKTLYLAAHASQFTAAIRWHQAGDLVIWDNRSTMHRATLFDDTRYARDMRRTTVYDRLD
jgi:alpha-ketoglutarate-dependent 2,4-dichlorophenoxyacetate dioxygenase